MKKTAIFSNTQIYIIHTSPTDKNKMWDSQYCTKSNCHKLGCTKTDTDTDTDTTRIRENANLKIADTGTRKW